MQHSLHDGALLAELARVLKPGGTLHFHEPTSGLGHSRACISSRAPDVPVDGHRTSSQVITALKLAGFVNVVLVGCRRNMFHDRARCSWRRARQCTHMPRAASLHTKWGRHRRCSASRRVRSSYGWGICMRWIDSPNVDCVAEAAAPTEATKQIWTISASDFDDEVCCGV